MRVLSLILLCCLSLSARGSKAFPFHREVRQPNGEKLSLCMTGDEHFHAYTTLDGILVCQDTTHTWCYATLRNNQLASTGIQARNKALRSYFEQQAAETFKEEADTQVQQMQASRMRKSSSTQQGAPLNSLGSPVIPVILVQFQDVQFTAQCTPSFFDKHFNASNYKEEGGWGSIRDYFIAQSDSLFMPTFKILGVVTLPNNMSYYGQNWGGNDRYDRLMEQQAIDTILARGVSMDDFLVQGKIPMTAFIYAGYGEQAGGSSNTVWAKCYSAFSYTSGGYQFRGSVCTNEIANYTGTEIKPDGIGTFCHEFSHGLGLPDFYATNGLSNNFGLDYWDIMDWGQYCELSQRPVGYSAYERMYMGWLQPTTLSTTEAQNIVLQPLANKREGIRSVMIPNSSNATEYLMLENRTESTWFSPYYGEGMLVYHIDFNASAWNNNTVNNTRSHQCMSILPADNTLTPYYIYSGGKYIFAQRSDYQGDLYPGLTGNMELSDTSIPADVAFTGSYFHRTLSRITQLADKSVYFEYMPDETTLGDINKDGVRNVGDLTLLVSMIMEGTTTVDETFIHADVNEDGILNVGDITTLVGLIMGSSTSTE